MSVLHNWTPSKLSFAPPPDILRSHSHRFPTIVYAIGLSGYGGLTVPLSLFLDLFNALTLHVSLSHVILKRALSYQTSALRSLWNLFRGRDSLLRMANNCSQGLKGSGSMSCISALIRGITMWTNSSSGRSCSRYLRSAFRHY